MNLANSTTESKRLADNLIGDLNDLIEINFDSEKGFRETADDLENPKYQAMFREVADERHGQAKDLQSFVEKLGDDASEQSSSLTAQAHRWWAEIRDAVSHSDNHAILAEAERGEDKILHMYQDISEKLQGTQAYDLVRSQLDQVKSRHDLVREARDFEKKKEDS